MKPQTVIKTFRTYSNPLWYYALYLNLVRPSTTRLNLRNGLKFYIRPTQGDHFVINEVFLHKDQQIALQNLQPQSSIVIDIGAYIGDFTLLASLHAKQVIAYEPESDNLKLLNQNILLNRRNNILVRPYAVHSHSGKHPLHLHKHSHSHSLFPNLVKKAHHKSKTQTVNCVTLLDEIKTHRLQSIDLLKLDCEGAEFSILTSLPDQIFNIINQIILEYHDRTLNQSSHQNLIDLLHHHGYQTQIVRKLNPTTGIIYALNKNYQSNL